VGAIDLAAFEAGELTDTEAYALFQRLIDTGDAWKLPESFSRTSAWMLMRNKISWTDAAEASYRRQFPLIYTPEDMFKENLFHHAALHVVAATEG
jgi:hypothetical protein